MKKRIIASILALVMTVLALVSCGAGFNFAENSDEYATVDLDGFLNALKAVEIEDADFTTNEETRLQKVKYNLLGTLTDAAVKEADKKTEGSLTLNDVLYFCYYVTYEETTGEGDDAVTKTYYFLGDQMKTSTITSGTTTNKATHVIELATVKNNEEDKYANALYDALKAAMGEASELLLKGKDGEVDVDKIYTVKTTKKDVKDELEENDIDSVVISYTRKSTAEGAKEEKALYETLVLNKDHYAEGSAEDQLVELMLKEGVTAKIGDVVTEEKTIGEGESATTETRKDHSITVDGQEYKYSNVKIEWASKNSAEALVTFKHTPYTTTKDVEPDNLHATDAAKIKLKDKELTYHVFPVNYIDVPELTGENIITEIIGSGIKADTCEIFSSEDYKDGDKTVKALVEELVKLWANDEETLKLHKDEKGEKSLYDLKKAWDDLNSEHNHTSGDDEDKDAHTAIDKAKEAFDDAKEYATDKLAKKVAAAKNADDKTVGDAVLEEYVSPEGAIYKELKSEYDSAIVDAVGKEVWKLIDKYVTVSDDKYPEDMVEEFYDHLYETYEYNFYKGTDSTSKKSNYLEYGTLENYLIKKELKADGVTSADGIEAAITKRAKDALKPIIQVYALAIALDNTDKVDVTALMKSYVEADKAGHAYDILDKDLDADKKAEQEEAALESYEQALKDSENFVVTDKVFKDYKKQLGKSTYRAWEEQYGEVNIRAALQSNRLMYFLLCTDLELNADEDGVEVKYEEIDGVNYISFRTLSYVIKAEDAEDEGDSE